MQPKTRSISYLFRFMLIFEINRFEIFDASDTTIRGRVGWADDGSLDYDRDEEIQDIEWEVQDHENFEDALRIAEQLIDERLMINDKISIGSEYLSKQMGWDKNRYDAAINTLLDVKVDMLDEGKKSDFFFVHF